MWNKMIEWLNVRDNVTFLIAVASFALSIWNFASDKIKNRKNLMIKVQKAFRFEMTPDNGYTEVLNVVVINKSREAITLSGMKLLTQSGNFRFGIDRRELVSISNKSGNKEISRSTWYSDVFPVKIEGLGYAQLLLSSTNKENGIQENEPYVLELFSNKGKVRKTFTSDFSSAESLSQCRAPDLHTEALE